MEHSDETKTNDTVKIVSAALLGVAVGIGLGMLFAPDKGSETRKKLAEKGEGIKDSIKNKFSDLVDEIKNEFAKSEGKANNNSSNI